MEYCYAVPSDDYHDWEDSDELKHYGVKGMHWGIRRYQPYPTGSNMSKRKAKKAVRIINSNQKRNIIREYYKEESKKAYDIHMKKAEEAKRDGKIKKSEKQLKKASKQLNDYKTLNKKIDAGKSEINKALNNLKKQGYITVTNTKVKRFQDYGRQSIQDLFSPAGTYAVSTRSSDGSGGSATAIIQKPYSKHKLENSRYGKKEHTGITKRSKAENSVDKIQSKYYPNRKWTDESATKALKKDNVKLTDLELKAAKRSINGKWTDGMYHPSYEHLYNYEKKRRGLK